MKLLFLMLVFASNEATPETPAPWSNERIGAPCTLEIDIIEGTCHIVLKDKPDWTWVNKKEKE
jgi:hypothetical protein